MKVSNSFTIEFHPVTLKAFLGKRGHWTNYDEIEKAGITSLKVEPVLSFHHVDHDLTCVDINLYFDEKEFDKERFNIVYGDGQFEDSVRQFMEQFFPSETFGSCCYTESGMQGEDYISMEYPSETANILRAQSSHFLLALQQNPLVKEVHL